MHVPPVSIVTVAPLTLQTLEVLPSMENETGSPLVAVALTAKVPPLDHVCVGGCGKLIDWFDRATTVWLEEFTKPESFVARTTNVYEPVAVGVPLRNPVAVFRVRPVGKEPDASE